MIRTILQIRLRQLNGLGRGLSPFLMLFIVVMLYFFALQFYAYTQQPNGAFYLAGGVWVWLLAIQIQRDDKAFLSATLPNFRQWLWIEYLLICLPFALLLGVGGHYLYAIGLLLSTGCLPFLHISIKKKSNQFRWLKNLLPPSFFEWKAGIQQYGVTFFILYALGLGFAWLPFASLFLAWGLTLLVGTFYKECESLAILDTTLTTPTAFLRKKISAHLALYCLFILPILGLFTIFHPEQAWIAGVIFLFFGLSLVISILAKYSYYMPNTFLEERNPIVLLTGACLIVPFLLPILVILLPILLYKSHKNLSAYVAPTP